MEWQCVYESNYTPEIRNEPSEESDPKPLSVPIALWNPVRYSEPQ